MLLIKECIDGLNQRISGTMKMARKSMIMCGLIPDSDGVRKISQLSSELKEIAARNVPSFNGQPE